MEKSQHLALKKQVHKLRPVVIIGAKGLTTAVHNEIACALDAHELIKIRVNAEDQAHRDAMITDTCNTHDATLITQIGHVVAIYRPAQKN